jgi:hypothetical protein
MKKRTPIEPPSTQSPTTQPTNGTSTPWPESDTEVHDYDPPSEMNDSEPEETVASISGPRPDVRELVQTYPRVVSVDHTPQSGADEFSVMIHNTGIGGDITVKLYWVDESGDRQYLPARENTLFFEADERREVSFTENPPQNAEEYEFETTNGTRGAVIKNAGQIGYITAKLISKIGGIESIRDERTIYISEGASEEVVFDDEFPLSGMEWNVEAEPAD